MTSGITQSSELQVLTNKAPVVVGIHQPNYLPWFGYFLKMAASDIFVFHDDAGLNSKGLTLRVRISHQEPHRQPRWLSVPLQRHAANTRICNLLVCKDRPWHRHHLALLANTYVHAPYFYEVMPLMETMFQSLHECKVLSHLNIYLIQEIAAALDLHPGFKMSSDYSFRSAPSETNASLVAAVGGTHYLSGKGANAYETPESYSRHGIFLFPTDAAEFLDRQLRPFQASHRAGLSMVDLWMHLGTAWMKETVEIWKKEIRKSLS